MTVVVACCLAVAAFFYILFIRKQDIPEPVPVSPVQHLDDRKQAIYENLRDLQFEYRLGKLSDDDYASTKQALQRELAVVLAETEETVKRLGTATVSKNAPKKTNTVCPHCGASFSGVLKFCGECGKAIA
jgi:hypothetical protein